MNPPPADWRVGSNPKALRTQLPMPCARHASVVKGVRLPLGHGYTKHRSRTREEGRTNRAQTCERCGDSWGLEGSTDAGVCVGFGGFGNYSKTSSDFGKSWFGVLGDLLDCWSETLIGTSRHSTHDQVVFKLRQDRRAGTLVGVGCGASLVYQSEWSDRDSSGGEADRSDGCSEHSMDEFAWFHTERQSQVGLGRDKGCQ